MRASRASGSPVSIRHFLPAVADPVSDTVRVTGP
jgi:hypothetical protein